jgi:hypothetical protein
VPKLLVTYGSENHIGSKRFVKRQLEPPNLGIQGYSGLFFLFFFFETSKEKPLVTLAFHSAA